MTIEVRKWIYYFRTFKCRWEITKNYWMLIVAGSIICLKNFIML